MSDVICEECRIGRCSPVTVSYLHWTGEQFIVMPNAPAYRCDMCKHVEYDARFMRYLEYTLDELTDEVAALPRRRQPHKTRDGALTWPQARRSG